MNIHDVACDIRSIETFLRSLMISIRINKDSHTLLGKDRSITVHHRTLHSLVIEMYKVLKGIGPVFMNEIFVRNGSMGTENVSSNTRGKSKFYNQFNPKTVKYGLETLRCLGS